MDLSLGFLFCSIDLYFCLCASTLFPLDSPLLWIILLSFLGKKIQNRASRRQTIAHRPYIGHHQFVKNGAQAKNAFYTLKNWEKKNVTCEIMKFKGQVSQQVLLKHSHADLFTHHLWCFHATRTQVSSCNKVHLVYKPIIFNTWSFTEKLANPSCRRALAPKTCFTHKAFFPLWWQPAPAGINPQQIPPPLQFHSLNHTSDEVRQPGPNQASRGNMATEWILTLQPSE